MYAFNDICILILQYSIFMMTGSPNPGILAVRRQSLTRQPANENLLPRPSIAEVAGHRQVSERQNNRSGECPKLTRGSNTHGAL